MKLRLASVFLIACSVAGAEPIVPQSEGDGALLLAELSCTACHAAPEAWREQLAPKAAPLLADVGSRLEPPLLQEFIGRPQAHKPGTLMPGLFAGEAADAQPVAALADYLSSLRQPGPEMPAGDAERGRELYHRVGCVACHAPDGTTRPSGIPAEQEVLKPATPSMPIVLARDYHLPALAGFLLDPLRVRPAGRMPSLHLTPQEAGDLAQYLHPAPDAPADKAMRSSEAITAGRAQFIQQGCSACHQTGEPLDRRAAAPLAQLSPARGCLAPTQPSGIPNYGLSEPQREALQNALRQIQAGPPTAPKIDWQLARLNCYACHTRAGRGGPEAARAQYFSANDAGAESLGELAHLPPNLDRVGRKLTPAWFAKILWGEGGGVRPYLNTRMPDFGQAQTEPLIAWLTEADRREPAVTIDTSGVLGHQRAEIGRKLIGSSGLGCVSCHGLKDRKSLGPPVIRLTQTAARLRPEYFKELLLDPQTTQPGTLMPPLFAGRKAADKEIESLWTYLKEIESQPLPEGLFDPGDFELKPAVDGRPIVLRSFIEGSGSHAIGVGFPQGLNASFDARGCRWALLWKGRFLDAMSNWQDRMMKPIKPLGTDLQVLPADDVPRVFLGYRLEKSGVPIMLYREAGVEIEDKLEPSADGKTFVRTVKRGGGAPLQEIRSW